MSKRNQVPRAGALEMPTLKALVALGGSARVPELLDRLASDLKLSDETLDIPYKEGGQTEFYVQTSLARTRLNREGAIRNFSHGVWVINNKGRTILGEDAHKRIDYVEEEVKGDHELDEDVSPSGEAWKNDLLKIVWKIPSDAFERLCQLLLREAGFTKVIVTKRTHDGGIDGTSVLEVGLLSFRVAFQCKRYSNSKVSVEAIDRLRGVISNTDKGLFITSSTFTREAQERAAHGQPPMDLIDGNRLCDLLREHKLGLIVKERVVEKIEFNHDFFDSI